MTTIARNVLILAATGGSAALLAGAVLFQAAGYAPCAMCLWQRWPHAAAIVLGVLALALGGLGARALAWLGAAAAAATAALGLYHTGVERDWWEGPASCTGTGGLDAGDLLSLDGPRLVMCDQVSWAFAGLSMASWNAVLSAALVVLWVMAARRRA
jgi:disulfide bond formation protein DsbB